MQTSLGVSAEWLRDNCRCAECRDAVSGQKLFDLADSPAIAEIAESAAEVTVVFADGHRSVFDRAWLAAPAPLGHRDESSKDLWTRTDVVSASWLAYLDDDAERLRCLDSVLRNGFVLLRGVPTRPGAVLEVAETFGFVRETNYGRLFDVHVVDSPNNLAFTSKPITPHTDNPYRDPVPTLQLLHCLENAAAGGETTLVDGFAVAARLRAEDPEAFAVLTQTPVTFSFADATTFLSAFRPIIDVDPAGRIREVRINNRSMQPGREHGPEFYRAYRAFRALLTESQAAFRLEPGDCLLFDNTRILHARTGFETSGSRHLQGCYADIDALASSAAVLRRTPVAELAAMFTGPGAAAYLGEPVTQAQHMLLAGAAALHAQAPDHLVAAALLHDIGHLVADEQHHDTAGARFLARWFPPAVTEPVRLHVAAKRYLCATEPGYFESLSQASVRTLGFQGGPMSEVEAAEFAAGPYAEDAVTVRRWDEAAKDPEATVPGFSLFAPLLERLVRP
ncbi:TauD/TfdA family dioxygenase [Kutzneria sp. CA-103260]|uniref:TauD/TfdA family dioxygenase n=1 Tax=Kutzneria sp. CA-103260 TaxID=2802641 RepID=UPI001BAB9DD7|nr:TauD/TfdA family dioxygenase [Kutzneria sp. CA-103260]